MGSRALEQDDRRDRGYGVRLLGTRTLGDQLGLVLSPKSKIEDGSDIGTWGAHVTSVADFR